MSSTARRGKHSAHSAIPPSAWHSTEAVWGSAQRVRLITGPPSLIEDTAHVRSVHLIGFLPPGDSLLLVQNKDNTWTFPGGRLEGGESIADALEREVWEEARARIAPGWASIATTRIDFLNRVKDRVYRFHPSYLLELADEPCHDPADYVIAREVTGIEEARRRLGPMETRVLDAALAAREGGVGC
jgi:8-oxo-dGTP pyrophosphatase MutT (NUDIX family)